MGTTELLPDGTRLGTVHLRVTDVSRVLPVWRDLVGLSVLSNGEGMAALGLDSGAMVVLHGGASTSAQPKARGLFHVAVHVPTRYELAKVLARFRASGLRHSGQDHLTSESLYISDTDGNGIEVCLDTLDRGYVEQVEGRVRAVANDGSVHSGLEPLDLDGLLAELRAGESAAGPLKSGSFIGHIHMRARAPDAVMAFYIGVLGFKPNIQSPMFGMHDVGTPSRRHMVAFNTWAGADLVEPAQDAAGLAEFTIAVPSAAALGAVAGRVKAAGVTLATDGGALLCADPEGNRLRIVAAD